MESPEVCRWIWLATSVTFVAGEMATPGIFFLLPFGLGAAVACISAFLGLALGLEWLLFVGVSAAAFAALWPLRERLDRGEPVQGIGARRLIGEPAKVLDAIPGGHAETGLVRVGREEWRAETVDGRAVEAGRAVKVVEVRGTRLIVWPLDAAGAGVPEPGEGEEN